MSNIKPGLPCRVWINLFDDNLNLLGSALTFGGLVDQPTISEGSSDCTISLSIESRMSDCSGRSVTGGPIRNNGSGIRPIPDFLLSRP